MLRFNSTSARALLTKDPISVILFVYLGPIILLSIVASQRYPW